MNPIDVVKFADTVAKQSDDTKFWVVLIALGIILGYLYKQMSKREETLRTELKAASEAQLKISTSTAELVAQNSEVVRQNTVALTECSRALSETNKILHKFV